MDMTSGRRGGGLDSGETFEEAARHELLEETGIIVEQLGTIVTETEFPLRMPDGEVVLAQERFFRVDVPSQVISSAG